MAGIKALWGWMKAHPWTAAVVFLVVFPFLLLGIQARIKNTVGGLPGVGPLLNQLPEIGA